MISRILPTKKEILYGVGLAYIVTNLMFTLGALDSPRSNPALKHSNKNNPVKTVQSVDESIKFSGWQPVYRRTVTFNDGSKSELKYHVHWYKDMTEGEMFDPKEGEDYEVAELENILGVTQVIVQKIE